ncbi:MAG: hypothetical protein L0L09_14360, partial [Staphylococcus equorum]|nr:hypothetical protein [Staphylococcus equorum]
EGRDFNDIYAPVVGVDDVRLLCGLAVVKKMKMVTFDVKTAFLNAPIDLDLYIKMPKGTKDYTSDGKQKVYKVLQALYGLRQAPKRWYDMFTTFLVSIGFTACTFSSNIFVKGSGENQIIIAVYVDDTLVMSSNLDALDATVDEVTKKFKTDEPAPIKKFLGLNIKQSEDFSKVHINGAEYINKVATRMGLEHCIPSKTPMATSIDLENPTKIEDKRSLNAEEHSRYRSLVGSLRYLTTVMRLDIANATRRLSHYLASPTLHHWKLAVYLFGYVMKTKNYTLQYEIRDDNDKQLKAYSDASFALTDESKFSVSGGVILFGGAPIYWVSQRQHISNKSAMDSELIALDLVGIKVSRLRNLLNELDYTQSRATVVYEDNQALCMALKNEGPYQGHPNLGKKFENARLATKTGLLSVEQVDTLSQLADGLTKSFASSKMEEAVNNLHCGTPRGGVLVSE